LETSKKKKSAVDSGGKMIVSRILSCQKFGKDSELNSKHDGGSVVFNLGYANTSYINQIETLEP
jgi:hypothetical protein